MIVGRTVEASESRGSSGGKEQGRLRNREDERSGKDMELFGSRTDEEHNHGQNHCPDCQLGMARNTRRMCVGGLAEGVIVKSSGSGKD